MIEPKKHMKIVCGWCEKHLFGPKDSSIISRGICSDCEAQFLKEAKEYEKTNPEVHYQTRPYWSSS